MFRKSGYRFCEKNMLKQRDRGENRFNWNGFALGKVTAGT